MCVYTHIQTHTYLYTCIYRLTKSKGHEATGAMSGSFLPSWHVLSHHSGHWRPIKLITPVSKMVVAGGGKCSEGKDEARLYEGGL